MVYFKFNPLSRLPVLVLQILLTLGLAPAVISGQVPVGTEIVNVAHLSYRNSGGMTFTTYSDTVVTTVSAGVQLEFSKSVDHQVITPGDTLNYQIQLFNSGNTTAYSLAFRDTLTAGIRLTGSSVAVNNDNGIITWSTDSLAEGGYHTNILTVVCDSLFAPGALVHNRAGYRYNNGIWEFSNQTSTAIDTISVIDLWASVNREIAQPGDTVTSGAVLMVIA